MVANDKKPSVIDKIKKLSKKQKIISGACLCVIMIILISIFAIIGQNANKNTVENSICASIGGNYHEHTSKRTFDEDLESAELHRCNQKTFDRLAEERKVAEEKNKKYVEGKQEEEAERARKKAECEASGKVQYYMYLSETSNGCITKEEAAILDQKKADCSKKSDEDYIWSYNNATDSCQSVTTSAKDERDRKAKETEENKESAPKAQTPAQTDNPTEIPNEETSVMINKCKETAKTYGVTLQMEGMIGDWAGQNHVWMYNFRTNTNQRAVCQYNWKTFQIVSFRVQG